MVKKAQYRCLKSAQLFELLGKKRVIFMIKAMDEGADTYTRIREEIGLANTAIVSQRLSELEEAKIITREVVSDKPVQVKYFLTEQGKKICAIIDQLGSCVE